MATTPESAKDGWIPDARLWAPVFRILDMGSLIVSPGSGTRQAALAAKITGYDWWVVPAAEGRNSDQRVFGSLRVCSHS